MPTKPTHSIEESRPHQDPDVRKVYIESDLKGNTINAVLKDRGSKYNPNPERRYKELAIWHCIATGLDELMPDDVSEESLSAISLMLLKAARAIEGGLHGVYHHDNSVDFEGYSKVLVGTVLGIPPEDVTE